MKNWIRKLLGIAELKSQMEYLEREMYLTRTTLTPALNTLVVKLTDEFDPARRKLSDEIGRTAIDKAKHDDWARRHTLGEV